MEIVLAVISAIAYGVDTYFVRKGLIESPFTITATFITLSVNFFMFLVLFFLFVPIDLLRIKQIYIFIIAGILAPGCARAFAYKGLQTLGMSISTPIVNAETLFSVLIALIFLKEPMTISIGTGVLSTITGVVLLSFETGRNNKKNVSGKIQYRYLFFPLTASLFYGVSVFLRKLGLNFVHSPILGAFLTLATSWCVMTIFLFISRNAKQLFQVKRRSYVYFAMGGICSCVAWLSLFYALNIGKVIIVCPIAASYSLVTLLLSYLLLRSVERLTLNIGIATILVVGGVALLTLSR